MNKSPFFRVKRSFLPQISRLFTERPFFWAFSGLLFGVLASFSFWGYSRINAYLSQQLNIIASKKDAASLTRSYNDWKRVVEEKPAYRDGYVMLAWYAKELGKTEEEEVYLQKVLSLDPNYSLPEVLQIDK